MPIRLGRSYTHSGDHICCCGFVFLLAVIVPLVIYWLLSGALYMAASLQWASNAVPFDQGIGATGFVKNLPVTAHLDSDGWLMGTAAIRDRDFGVRSPSDTLRLTRKVDYCQWVEHSITAKNDDNTYSTRFWYTKSWHSHRVLSALFDDPFSHHNPWHDPFPAQTIQATDGGRLKHATRKEAGNTTLLVDREIFASTPQLDRVWLPRSRRSVERLHRAPAFASGFRYIGNGQFYYAYEEHLASLLARTFLRVATDSFDIQLGDLLPGCTAGDIRVTFVTTQLDRDVTVAGAITSVGTKRFPRHLLHPYRAAGTGASFAAVRVGTIDHQEHVGAIQADTWTTLAVVTGVAVVAVCIFGWLQAK